MEDLEAAGILSAGKTGTAEYCDDVAQAKGLCITNNWPDSLMVCGICPIQWSRNSGGAFVYNGGEGASVSAPIVEQVLQAYFDLKAADISNGTSNLVIFYGWIVSEEKIQIKGISEGLLVTLRGDRWKDAQELIISKIDPKGGIFQGSKDCCRCGRIIPQSCGSWKVARWTLYQGNSLWAVLESFWNDTKYWPPKPNLPPFFFFFFGGA